MPVVPASRKSYLDHGAARARVGIVRQVPRRPGDPVAVTEDREALTDVGEVGVAVHEARVAEQRDALASDDGGEHTVAQGRGDAGAGPW